METENAEANMIIHLAVKHNNMGIIRYLLSNRSFFHLFEDENESKPEAPSPGRQGSSDRSPLRSPEPINKTNQATINPDQEENILTLQNGEGNTAIHLMYKHAQFEMLKFVLQTAYKIYAIPLPELLDQVNSAGY